MNSNLIKFPGETRWYGFDFGKQSEIAAGDTLTGTPTVTASRKVGSGVETLVVGSPSIADDTDVIFSVAGGYESEVYELLCTCSTSGGAILQAIGTLEIRKT